MSDLPPRRPRPSQDELDRVSRLHGQAVQRVLGLTGPTFDVHPGRRNGKDRLAVFVGAAYELEGLRWDVVGTDPDRARQIRRQARALAAELDTDDT
jgi:hypothetical protein